MDADQLADELLRMKALTAIVAVLALVATGCGTTTRPHRSDADQAPERPTGVATLVAPFGRLTVGARGRIWGFAADWPIDGHAPALESGNPRFTYVTDFQIIEISPVKPYLPIKAAGIRRIYFHPSGLRPALGDVSRFVNGQPIAIEEVKFTFEYMRSFGQVELRMRAHQTSARAFECDGRTIRPAAERDESFEMFGRYSAQYRGLLLTTTGT